MDMSLKLHILHIEDDPVDAELIRQTLLRSELACAISLAMSRAEYTKALQAGGIDLILSDNRGYDFDGLEVLRTVRRHYPHIPFLFLSGSFEGKDLERLKAEGASDCLLKSETELLVPAIQRALKGIPPGPQDMYLRGLERLLQVTQELPRAQDLDALSAAVCRAARELCGADAAIFVLREAEVCHYVAEDSISPLWKGLRVPVSGCLSGWCMRQREIAVAEDIHADPRVMRSELRGTVMQSEVAIPLPGEEAPGALALFWRSRHRPNADELKLLHGLTQAAAVALENMRRLADLELRFKDRGRDLDAVTRELEAFSYAVSHDLRGPLRSVSGFGKLLANDYEDRLDEAGKNFLAYVTDGTLRISALVDALLELSRASRTPLEKQSVDVSKMAQEVAAAFKQREPERRVEVTIEPGLHAEADPRLLRTALENLLGNAWKFSSRRAEAHIAFGRDSSEDDAFYVRDDGAGFEMAYSDKLFTPFQRQHRQDEFEGAGVGLAMVQRIVMRHGGRIWAEAVEGEGAAFFFTLAESSRNLKG
jgi:hypothetical protein